MTPNDVKPTAFSPLGGPEYPTRKKKEELESELENLQKVLDMLGTDGKSPARHPKGKF